MLSIDETFEQAYYKGLIASGYKEILKVVLLSVAHTHKRKLLPIAKKLNEEGYQLYATKGTKLI